MPELIFSNDSRFELAGVRFTCSRVGRSTADHFYIAKPRALVECYEELCRTLEGCNMVELGVRAGGSTALIAMLARPRKLVALEINDTPVVGLAEFITAHDLSETVRPFYGVDQADRPRLAEIMAAEFPEATLDMVIDDASHLLAESRSSFESLFPHLGPGGLYIIEDWNARHLLADSLRAAMEDPTRPDRQENQDQIAATIRENGFPPMPLSRLVMELTLARASSGDVVDEITIGSFWAVIRRGPGRLDPESFRVSDLYHDHFGLTPPLD